MERFGWWHSSRKRPAKAAPKAGSSLHGVGLFRSTCSKSESKSMGLGALSHFAPNFIYSICNLR